MYQKNDPRRNTKTVSLRSISYGIILFLILIYSYVYYTILPVVNHNKSEDTSVGDNNVLTSSPEMRNLISSENDKNMKTTKNVANKISTSSSSRNLNTSKYTVKLADPSLFQTIEAVNQYYDKVLHPLNDIVTSWRPDSPDDKPKDWVDVVPTFDWQIPESRKAAQMVREAEKPFKLINVNALADAKKLWTYDYLKKKLGFKKGQVEVSETKSFMYWKRKRSGQNGPTTYEKMDWLTFLDKAKKLDDTNGNPDEPHYYWHTSARNDPFIAEDLKMFKKDNNFFIVDPSEYTVPIACRIGTKGLCNENHYDTHRTFASQIFGSKRWIFQPPTECGKMYLYPDRHISARHSPIDINSGNIDVEKYPLVKTALAVDTVVHAGEMAYLPSNWFHHIISLEFNMQCVARSGHSLVGDDYIEECGFAGGRRSSGGKRKKVRQTGEDNKKK